MKFTLSWLKRFLDSTKSSHEIADALTQIGLEVEQIIDRRDELKDFEVAYIISTRSHPSSDKLKICTVQTKSDILQIICGASNARADIKVVLAKIGVEIPYGKFKIKESIIRGEKSCGMLCSESELLLGPDLGTIIELSQDAKIGDSLIKYYGLDDPIFHINITPNRGDALGIYSIARDLAAKNIGKFKELYIKEIANRFESKITLNIDNKSLVPLFSLCEIRNVENRSSPDWLIELLHNIGIKPVSAIVDITNYISYSFGQPMHVYDKDKFISNEIYIKQINKSISFEALNGKIYNLQKGDLVVRDMDQVQSLAGIIGGKNSSCELGTQNIILESACFSADSISITGRNLQINTDSRYRFERNIDQSFTLKALDIATEMILSICRGEVSQIIYEGEINPQCKSLEFPYNCLEKITGFKLPITETCSILEKLGFKPLIIGDIINLTIPSWRHDIAVKEDIIEEIMRIYGYDKIEEIKLPSMGIVNRVISREQRRISDIKRIIASCGYDEVVTNSFMSSKSAKLFAHIKEELFLINPISSDNDYMRPTIIPNLLKAISKNLLRSIKDIALFEVGSVFNSCAIEGEVNIIAGARVGNYIVKDYHNTSSRFVDIFDIKSDLEIILDYIGLPINKCQLDKIDLPYYHPTKSAIVKLGKNVIVHWGQVHPLILNHFDVNHDVFAFEINIEKLPISKAKFGKREEFIISDFQPTFRDYAFVVDIDQKVGDIMSCIRNVNKQLIKSVDLFDIYLGDKLPSGKKSIALKVMIQAHDRTLKEDDFNLLSQGIISTIEKNFNGKLRE